jgi:pimeloyl-ACP methyl ester carboxylesterase
MSTMRSIQSDGVRLAVVDDGSGPPILFVHGFPLAHAMWDEQRSISRGFRTIAPDLRGFGESDATAGTTSMDRFAADLHAVLDGLGVGEPVVYVGLSMGGYIAWPFIAQRPGRVRALVLANTRVVSDTPAAAEARRESARKVLSEGVAAIEAGMIEKLFSPVTRTSNPAVVEKAGTMIRRAKPEGVAGALLGMAERPDVSNRLAGLAVPTLVVAGEDDALASPTEMEGFARAIPDAAFVRVEGAGHMTPMENPAAFNGALSRFLQRVVST